MAHLAAAVRSARALPEVASLLAYPPPAPPVASNLIGRAIAIARPMAASAPQLLTGVYAAAASVQARSGNLLEALDYRRRAIQLAGPGGAPLEAVVLSAEQLTMGEAGGGGAARVAPDHPDAGDGGRLGRLHRVLAAAPDEASLVTALDGWVGAEHADDAAAGGDAPLVRGLLVYGGGDDEGWDPAAATGKPTGRPRRAVAVLEGLAAAHLLRGRLLLRQQRRDEALDALSAALVRLEHVSDALRVAVPPAPDEPAPAVGRAVHPALALQAVFTLTALGVAHVPPSPLTDEGAAAQRPPRAADSDAADAAATDAGDAVLRRALALARAYGPDADHVPSWAAAYPLVGLAGVCARRGEVVPAEGLLRAVADAPAAASAAAGGAGAVAAWVAAAAAAGRLAGRLSWNDQPRTADARAWAEKAAAGARAWGVPGTVVAAEAGAPARGGAAGVGGGRVPAWWGAAVRGQLAAAPCAGGGGGHAD